MKTYQLKKVMKVVKRDRYLLILAIPIILYYLIFHYFPMYGVIIAFKDYTPGLGITKSPWVGLRWFREFFNSFYFFRLLRNTILISLYGIIWGFPIPIIFALLLNEISDNLFKRTVQTISYLPHFLSVVVVVGMIIELLAIDGVINQLIKQAGFKPIDFMNEARWFRTIFIGSNIWQNFGWNSIIYLAALSSIDPQLYEAARIDGAGRWQQMRYITLPSIMPTAMILLILNIGSLLSVGFEKIILMYNPRTYEVADVISTYVYRRGILGGQYSFGAAVGLFNSMANLLLLLVVNKITKRVTTIGLW